jgi:hypothetical protein
MGGTVRGRGGGVWKTVLYASTLTLALAGAGTALPAPFRVPQTAADRRCRPAGNRAVDFFIPGVIDPALTRLFTPQGAPPGVYCAVPTDTAIDILARDYATREPASSDAAWRVRPVAPLDAFGSAAPYDRPTVALLFGGQRIRVARGPVRRDGRIVASITLASPYPDANLTRLMPGTLVIVFWIDDAREFGW